MAIATIPGKLKANCLGFPELLAQNIALISPTMTAALIVPVMYSNTADWSWLSYALGTIMLLFVAFNLNQFAKRSTSSGSMYAYICRGLGLTAGAIGGWALIWSYLGIAMAGVTGFTVFSGKLLSMMGIKRAANPSFRGLRCSFLVLRLEERQFVRPRDAALRRHFDGADHHSRLHRDGPSWLFNRHAAVRHEDHSVVEHGSRRRGCSLLARRLRGSDRLRRRGERPAEDSAKLGLLEPDHLRRFFVFVTYFEVQGTRGYSTTLDKIDQPLNILAQLVHIPLLQIPLSLGAMLSFFALNLSCVSAGGRIIYALGVTAFCRQQRLPRITQTRRRISR